MSPVCIVLLVFYWGLFFTNASLELNKNDPRHDIWKDVLTNHHRKRALSQYGFLVPRPKPPTRDTETRSGRIRRELVGFGPLPKLNGSLDGSRQSQEQNLTDNSTTSEAPKPRIKIEIIGDDLIIPGGVKYLNNVSTFLAKLSEKTKEIRIQALNSQIRKLKSWKTSLLSSLDRERDANKGEKLNWTNTNNHSAGLRGSVKTKSLEEIPEAPNQLPVNGTVYDAKAMPYLRNPTGTKVSSLMPKKEQKITRATTQGEVSQPPWTASSGREDGAESRDKLFWPLPKTERSADTKPVQNLLIGLAGQNGAKVVENPKSDFERLVAPNQRIKPEPGNGEIRPIANVERPPHPERAIFGPEDEHGLESPRKHKITEFNDFEALPVIADPVKKLKRIPAPRVPKSRNNPIASWDYERLHYYR